MKRWIISLLIVWIGCSVLVPPAMAKPLRSTETEFRLIVKTSAEAAMQSELRLRSKTLQKGWLKSKSASGESHLLMTDTSIAVREGGTETFYALDHNFDLYDPERKLMRVLPGKAKEELAVYVRTIRHAHYGKLVPWEEARQIVGTKAVCRVIDLETGLSFRVQRRAGNRHADMQPLTKADTAIMKEVYGGAWSWRRRAVLIEKDGQMLAASMHGMPHGGDGIPDNDFRGHFCVHFLGSTTHRSKSVDPDHQWMIYKAGGSLDERFAHASPYEVAESFIVALSQRDPELMRHGFADQNSPHLLSYLDSMSHIRSVKKSKPIVPQEVGDVLSLDIPVPVIVWYEGQKPQNEVLSFTMTRTDPASPWKIHAIHPSFLFTQP